MDKGENYAVEIIEKVCACGKNGAVSRLLFTDEWLWGRNVLKAEMEAYGLETAIDYAGNLIGVLRGESGEVILTGSHMDTVKNGGKYDGLFGVAAGIASLKQLKEAYGTPRKTLAVVAFAEEESCRFPFTFWGSKSFTGKAGWNDVKNIYDNDGISFVDAAKNSGHSAAGEALTLPVGAFFEIHIEQGGVLETEGKQIGIVEKIVAQKRHNIVMTGQANHAGTTPMAYRKDPMFAAVNAASQILGYAKQYDGILVATVGQISSQPGMANVIPEKVSFSLDIRHPDDEALQKCSDVFLKIIADEAKKCDVSVEVHTVLDSNSVTMDSRLLKTAEEICADREISYKRMHSGAGHDSQIMASYAPTAMIFVPSKGGISHSPMEFTNDDELLLGQKLLAECLYRLSY